MRPVNTIALQAITDGGLPNIDYLKVTGANPSPGNCGQPEPAAGPAAAREGFAGAGTAAGAAAAATARASTRPPPLKPPRPAQGASRP